MAQNYSLIVSYAPKCFGKRSQKTRIVIKYKSNYCMKITAQKIKFSIKDNF